MGNFEFTGLVGGGPREGPAPVTEKFAFQQTFRCSATVDLDKRLILSTGGLVNGSGNQPLAGAGLPVQHDGGTTVGNFFNNSEYFLHGAAAADDILEYNPGLSFERNDLVFILQIRI